jgi:chromosome segregation ATPase
MSGIDSAGEAIVKLATELSELRERVTRMDGRVVEKQHTLDQGMSGLQHWAHNELESMKAGIDDLLRRVASVELDGKNTFQLEKLEALENLRNRVVKIGKRLSDWVGSLPGIYTRLERLEETMGAVEDRVAYLEQNAMEGSE